LLNHALCLHIRQPSANSFAAAVEKQVQWEAFRRRLRREDTPDTLQEVVDVIARFLGPVTEALVTRQPFQQRWEPARGWAA
jgi:hypothetical protein